MEMGIIPRGFSGDNDPSDIVRAVDGTVKGTVVTPD